MDLNKLAKNTKTRVVLAFAVLGAMFTTGCASYQMQQDAQGNKSVHAQSVDGYGIGSALSGAGNLLSGAADIVGASKGHGHHHPRPLPPPPRRGNTIIVVPGRSGGLPHVRESRGDGLPLIVPGRCH